MSEAAERRERKRAAFDEIARRLEEMALAPGQSDEFRDAALRVRAVALNASRQLAPREPASAKKPDSKKRR